MTAALDRAIQLADEIEIFPLGKCGPSDDPDMQYAFTSDFRDIARRFVGAIKRIGDPELSDLISNINTDIHNYIGEAHDLRSELNVIIDTLRDVSADPKYGENVASNSHFLDHDLLLSLKATPSKTFDISKIVKMCEELNDNYARSNYIASVCLIRAVINHVPPIFKAKSFKEVVSQSGRSIKTIISRLEDEARPIADLHNHMHIRKKEHLPSKNQIEPYKAPFEILISEVVTRLIEDDTA